MVTEPKKSFFKYFGHNLSPVEAPLENAALKVLEKLSLKVTPPEDFNDPLEFMPAIDADNDNERVLDHMVQITTNPNYFAPVPRGHCGGVKADSQPNLAGQVLRQVCRQFNGPCERIYDTFQRSVVSAVSKHYGVVCFTTLSDHPLMWAHYAAAHHGLMLEFDGSAEIFQRTSFLHVDCAQEGATYDFSLGPTQRQMQVEALARRKGIEWKYEEEHRLVVPLVETKPSAANGGKQIHVIDIDPAWIKSVTFGVWASVDLKNAVAILRRQAGLTHVRAYRMDRETRSFQLVRREI